MLKKNLRASVSVFVLIMLGFIIGMYLVGYESPAVDLAGRAISGTDKNLGESFDITSFINSLGEAIMSPLGGTMIIMGIVGAAISALAGRFMNSGSSSIGFAQGPILTYLVPIFILFAVANVFFFPVIPAASAAGLPNEISFMMTIVFNVFLMLSCIEFISGRF